jgi:hypothetical protein
MPLERFIPKSPDMFIRNSQDFEVAKFGHLNTIVEYINNNSGGLKLSGNGFISVTVKTVLDPAGNTTPLRMSSSSITNYGGGSIDTNTAFGSSALDRNSTGANNTAFGLSAIYNNTTGSNNTSVGSLSLAFNNGSDNVAVGYRALRTNTSGSYNVGVGVDALIANTTGVDNVSIGGLAAQGNTTGSYNVVAGSGALYSNQTGRCKCIIQQHRIIQHRSRLRGSV